MKSVSTIIKELEKIKTQLSSSRDSLRELESEIAMQLEDKDEEVMQLESLIDSLSRYV